MHPTNSSNDILHQSPNRFESGLPPLPPFSPLILGLPLSPPIEYPYDSLSELVSTYDPSGSVRCNLSDYLWLARLHANVPKTRQPTTMKIAS